MKSTLQNTKIIQFYKKLTVANLLNWFAIRLFNVSTRFCANLISCAIYLDSSRSIFKRNLIYLGTKKNHYLPYSKKNFPFYTVPEGCNLLSAKIKFFDVNQIVQLTLPKVINQDFHVSEKYVCKAKLPDTYLAELDNVTIFGGTDLILARNLVLYDEVNRNENYAYGIKSLVIEKILKDTITIKLPKSSPKKIECGIHFAKDHSRNYFHWLVECLPRLSLISELDKNIPLLVDDDIPHQSLEAVQLLNSDGRKIIKLTKNTPYIVKKLYYPSQLSALHDNYSTPNYNKDTVYSPQAIKFIRESIFKILKILPRKGFRKIYVSRKNSDYRQLLNTEEIENLLTTKGFEIIFPEHLSFFAQVQIFSEAKIIIGQSGAGMTNFIFAPFGCTVLMMAGNARQTNLHGFHSLAELAGINFKFLLGKIMQIAPKYVLHADFYVDITLLLSALEDIDE